MEQETQKQQLISTILTSRFSRNAQSYLDEYFKLVDFSRDAVEEVLKSLEHRIEHPIEYPDYVIPDSIEINRRILIPRLLEKIEVVRNRPHEDLKTKTYELLVEQNRLIKYCTNRWLLPNAGVAIELMEVKSKLPEDFKLWLQQEFNVQVSDQIIHRHVISNEEREFLKSLGISVPYDNWDEHYYADAMVNIQQLLESNPNCKGILSDGSWTYNPKLFDTSSDGKPYASFTFMNKDKYIGHRFFLMKAEKGNAQEPQLEFAMRSERRKKMIESGELSVDVYGIFYPRVEVLSQDFNIT